MMSRDEADLDTVGTGESANVGTGLGSERSCTLALGLERAWIGT